MRLRVRADFRCYPVWTDDNGLWLDTAPASLPISDRLASDLNDWASAYDATFNEEYPPDSGFADQTAENAFVAAGRRLTNRLAQELGADAQVDYAGDNLRQLVIASAADDWISDYEIQGEIQAALSIDPPAAFAHLTTQVADWIRCGVLVPGDLRDGFIPWPGSVEKLAERFTASSSGLQVLARPGQICWFDTGPNATD